MNEEAKKIIIETANKYYPRKCNTIYSNSYYLKYINYLLKDIVSWRSLQNVCFENKPKNHYRTISRIHYNWSMNNVYAEALIKIRSLNIKCQYTENIYIDSTSIINKNGKEGIGYGGASRKKKFTAITIAVNDNSKPLISHVNEVYTKTLIRNNKTSIINTLSHDNKAIEQTIHLIDSSEKYYLIGDLGYIIDKKRKDELPDNVSLVTPKRKNQIDDILPEDKKRLKKRYKVENVFSKIKRFNRTHVRRDALIKTYMGFFDLASIYII